MKLFDYQRIGIKWLASKKYALLADKQRLGKTVQAIKAAEISLPPDAKILVICRAVAKEQWRIEFKRWSFRKFDLIVMSFEMACKINMTEKNPDFDLIIVDESHYLKNPEAIRTQKIFGRNGLVHKTKRMWLLTGTPTPNHAAELWPMLFTFGRTSLNYQQFVNKFCNSFENGYGLQITGTNTNPEVIFELKQLLEPIMLRRTEDEVSIQLPKVFKTSQFVSAGHVNLFEAFPYEVRKIGIEGLKIRLKDELDLFNELIGDNMTSELIEVLKATAKSLSSLRRYTAMQKVDPLVELVNEELVSGAIKKVVIFCIHTAAAIGLSKRLFNFNPAVVIGGTTNSHEHVFRFQNNPDCKVFIGNINAAGTSIELSAANHIYFLEESWVPGENHQAAMRCGGINQTKPIFVKTLLLENSIDIKVHENINRKTLEQQKIYERTCDGN